MQTTGVNTMKIMDFLEKHPVINGMLIGTLISFVVGILIPPLTVFFKWWSSIFGV